MMLRTFWLGKDVENKSPEVLLPKWTDLDMAELDSFFFHPQDCILDYILKHLPAVGFRIPLRSWGGSLLISVRLRTVAPHKARELLLLLEVLLLSPSTCLPVNPNGKTICQRRTKQPHLGSDSGIR